METVPDEVQSYGAGLEEKNMVKTHKESRFSLLTLAQIRDSKEVILQIEDTRTEFTDGQKCFLCEVVKPFDYNNTKNRADLEWEILTLNEEMRKKDKKIERLEREVKKYRERYLNG